MVVLSIVAILAVLAAPSLQQVLQSNARASAVNMFIADMAYARSEAIRRGGGVVMCRSDAPEALAPSCSTTSSHIGAGWAGGWIVFHDLDGNGLKDVGEPLLVVQAPLSSMDAILEGGAGVPSVFRFTGTGRLFALPSSVALTFGGSRFDLPSRRVVCVSFGGRARIAGDGSSDCGTGT